MIFSQAGRLYVFSNKGEIDFYRKDSQSFYLDFRPHVINRKIYYSALKVEDIYEEFTASENRQIFDENFNFIKEFPEELDMYDFILKDLDHYISTKYDLDLKSDGKCNVEQSIVEIENGKKVFEFNTSELLKAGYLYDYIESFNFKKHHCTLYFHLNGIQEIDGENKLLVSVRDNGIFVIDKKTKKIDWFWGGPSDEFPTAPEFLTGGHHQPQFDEKSSTITIFDNARVTKKSRIFDITLDLKNKTIEKFKPVYDDIGYAKIKGSVSKENKELLHWKWL